MSKACDKSDDRSSAHICGVATTGDEGTDVEGWFGEGSTGVSLGSTRASTDMDTGALIFRGPSTGIGLGPALIGLLALGGDLSFPLNQPKGPLDRRR